MEAVTIAGKIEDFNTIVSKYVVGREIHLENAISVLENGEKLHPFVLDNRYDSLFKMTKDIMDSAGFVPDNIQTLSTDMTYEDTLELLGKLKKKISDKEEKRAECIANIRILKTNSI